MKQKQRGKKSLLKKFPVGPSQRASKLMVILLIYCGNMSLIKGVPAYLLPSFERFESSSKECSVLHRRRWISFTGKINLFTQLEKKNIKESFSLPNGLHAIKFPRPTAPFVNLTPVARENYPSNSPLIWWNSHTCCEFFGSIKTFHIFSWMTKTNSGQECLRHGR